MDGVKAYRWISVQGGNIRGWYSYQVPPDRHVEEFALGYQSSTVYAVLDDGSAVECESMEAIDVPSVVAKPCCGRRVEGGRDVAV